jgi:hypothetical protein
MPHGWTTAARAQALMVLCATLSCSASDGTREPSATTSSDIVGGSLATAYPESVLIDMPLTATTELACSGSIIAPQVILTAGHCITGEGSGVPTKWVVTAPYAGNVPITASGTMVYDWVANPSGDVTPTLHDIGLVFLPTPIVLTTYPELAQSPVATNAKVDNIGRIDNGVVSFTNLYVSPSVDVTLGTSQGYPYSYISTTDEIQPGDSGGPDEVPASSPHLIVAVNSGAAPSFEALARVDLLYTWIEQQIAAHGGGGATPDAGSSSGDGGSAKGDGGAGSDGGGASGDGGMKEDSGGPESDGGTSGSSSGGGSSGASSGGADAAGAEFPDGGSSSSSGGASGASGSSGSKGGCSVAIQAGGDGGASKVLLAALLVALMATVRRRARAASPPSNL